MNAPDKDELQDDQESGENLLESAEEKHIDPSRARPGEIGNSTTPIIINKRE
ncbi:MAG: hypothetical protein JSR26_10750 [Proteobacteria bacterium]|nr:hypothetical protein [Pseudomonadota bacterium]